MAMLECNLVRLSTSPGPKLPDRTGDDSENSPATCPSSEDEVVGIPGRVHEMILRFSMTPTSSNGDANHSSSRRTKSRDSPVSPLSPSTGRNWSCSSGSPGYRTGWVPSSKQPRSVQSPTILTSENAADSPMTVNGGSMSPQRSKSRSEQHTESCLSALRISCDSGGTGNVSRLLNNEATSSPLTSPFEALNNGHCHDVSGQQTERQSDSGRSSIGENNTGLSNGYKSLDDGTSPKFVNRVTISLSPKSPTLTQLTSPRTIKSPPCQRLSEVSCVVAEGESNAQETVNTVKLSSNTDVCIAEGAASTTSPVHSTTGLVHTPTASSPRISTLDDKCTTTNDVCDGNKNSDVTSACQNGDVGVTKPVLDSTNIPDKNGTSQKDGQYFLRLVQSEEDRINILCCQMESELNGSISDEAAGKLRSAIGKARLLTSSKFHQFRALCNKNLTQDPNEQFKTTCQDLAGFWDLVMLQIDGVHDMFSEIEVLRKNGWKEVSPLTNGVPTSPTTKVSHGHTPSLSSKQHAAKSKSPHAAKSDVAKAREEARKRLMMAKAAGRQRKASETEPEVQIFIS